jgi:hypothetical protein
MIIRSSEAAVLKDMDEKVAYREWDLVGLGFSTDEFKVKTVYNRN